MIRRFLAFRQLLNSLPVDDLLREWPLSLDPAEPAEVTRQRANESSKPPKAQPLVAEIISVEEPDGKQGNKSEMDRVAHRRLPQDVRKGISLGAVGEHVLRELLLSVLLHFLHSNGESQVPSGTRGNLDFLVGMVIYP